MFNKDLKMHVQAALWNQSKRQQTLSAKGGRLNILGFAGHTISIAPAQLCKNSAKEAINNARTGKCGYALIKLYLQKQVVGQICHTGKFVIFVLSYGRVRT